MATGSLMSDIDIREKIIEPFDEVKDQDIFKQRF
jgi:hypothetical protein